MAPEDKESLQKRGRNRLSKEVLKDLRETQLNNFSQEDALQTRLTQAGLTLEKHTDVQLGRRQKDLKPHSREVYGAKVILPGRRFLGSPADLRDL